MHLSESLVWALENYDISAVKVFCSDAFKNVAAEAFSKDFASAWEEAQNKAEKKYGNCERKDIPVKTVISDYGFRADVLPLDIRYDFDNYYDNELGAAALDTALKNLRKKYPEIRYEGYVCYPLSDAKAGTAIQWEMSSDTDNTDSVKIYDFTGEKLGEILSEGMFVPEEPFDAEELNFAAAGKLKYFENQEELSDYIDDIGGSFTGSVSGKTNYLISNDPDGTSSKHKKARESGAEIISEREFIASFGDPDDFDDFEDTEDSYFWSALGEQLEMNGDYEETIESLYAYSKWIKKNDLDRAVRVVINIAASDDEEEREALIDFARKLMK